MLGSNVLRNLAGSPAVIRSSAVDVHFHLWRLNAGNNLALPSSSKSLYHHVREPNYHQKYIVAVFATPRPVQNRRIVPVFSGRLGFPLELFFVNAIFGYATASAANSSSFAVRFPVTQRSLVFVRQIFSAPKHDLPVS